MILGGMSGPADGRRGRGAESRGDAGQEPGESEREWGRLAEADAPEPGLLHERDEQYHDRVAVNHRHRDPDHP
jgi:hypothetical protein